MKDFAETQKKNENTNINNFEIIKKANLDCIENKHLKNILLDVIEEDKLDYNTFGTYGSFDKFESKPIFT
jgi:hypothetical protein